MDKYFSMIEILIYFWGGRVCQPLEFLLKAHEAKKIRMSVLAAILPVLMMIKLQPIHNLSKLIAIILELIT